MHKLFTLGPVEMYEYTRERLSEQLPYFRTEEFSKINLECAERLRRLAGAPDDSHVFLLTCSGTGAMEAVVGGCFSGKYDKLLVVDGGGFGHRFTELAGYHGIPIEAMRLEFEETLKPEMIEARIKQEDGFTGMLVNLHETTTGQIYDKSIFSSFCSRYGLYHICDAVGSFLADPMDFTSDGIDALIVSSQKALALPPGLAIVILSDRLYQKILKHDIKPYSQYFDFIEAESNALRGQTPYTPAVGIISAMHERLCRLEEEGGAEASVERTKALAEDFRSRIGALISKGLISLPAHPLSNACTPLIFPRGNAKDIYRKLSEGHGIWLNPNGGALADIVLRVGHLGDLAEEDNAMLAGLLADIL